MTEKGDFRLFTRLSHIDIHHKKSSGFIFSIRIAPVGFMARWVPTLLPRKTNEKSVGSRLR